MQTFLLILIKNMKIFFKYYTNLFIDFFSNFLIKNIILIFQNKNSLLISSFEKNIILILYFSNKWWKRLIFALNQHVIQ